MKRPTIIDIAREVGVSKAAVSYALNGRGGVSARTRERILEVAAELGWRASSAARALSSDRAACVGIVLARSPEVLHTEPFFMQMVAGLERTLSEHGVSLQLALATDTATELATYQRWWAERRVDGVVVTDLRVSDPRPQLLRELGTPTVFFGTAEPMPGSSVLRVNENDVARAALAHLVELGHQRIGHVQGPRDLQHTVRREQALRAAARDFDVVISRAAGGYTEEGGVRATRRLLAARDRPTAIVYDNDVMAVAVVAGADDLGIGVPADLSVLAWDDSMLCRVVRPAVTAFAHGVAQDAATAARMLLELVETGAAEDGELSSRHLVPRASTAAR